MIAMKTNMNKIIGIAADSIPELQWILKSNGWSRDLIDNPYHVIDYEKVFRDTEEYKTALEQMVLFLAENYIHLKAINKKIVSEGLPATVIQVKDAELDPALRASYYEAYLKKYGRKK